MAKKKNPQPAPQATSAESEKTRATRPAETRPPPGPSPKKPGPLPTATSAESERVYSGRLVGERQRDPGPMGGAGVPFIALTPHHAGRAELS